MSGLVQLLLALQALAAAPPLISLPPADWSVLKELPYLHPIPGTSDLSDFVRDEVRAGRCVTSGPLLRIDLAVLIGSEGRVRRIIPRAIDCPTVEQYASGVVSRLARSNVSPPPQDTWYRTTVTFSWTP